MCQVGPGQRRISQGEVVIPTTVSSGDDLIFLLLLLAFPLLVEFGHVGSGI
jgi:hypothetical protein